MSSPDLAEPVLLSLLGGGFVAAFLHAALPTHWLPFVIVGRGQGWGAGKTLTIAAGAGVGHTLSTMLLGVLLTGAGLAFERRFGGMCRGSSAACWSGSASST